MNYADMRTMQNVSTGEHVAGVNRKWCERAVQGRDRSWKVKKRSNEHISHVYKLKPSHERHSCQCCIARALAGISGFLAIPPKITSSLDQLELLLADECTNMQIHMYLHIRIRNLPGHRRLRQHSLSYRQTWILIKDRIYNFRVSIYMHRRHLDLWKRGEYKCTYTCTHHVRDSYAFCGYEIDLWHD